MIPTTAEKTEQLELGLYRVNTAWIHLFKEVIHSKKWANMSASAHALYPVIKTFADPQTGYTVPNYKVLQMFSGLKSRTSISAGLQELENIGYLNAIKKPGKPTIYQCREIFEIKDTAGDIIAQAACDYVPQKMNQAQLEIKDFVRTNMPVDGKLQYIRIDRLTINVAGNIIAQQNNNSTTNIYLPPEQYLKGMKDLLARKETIESRIVEDLLKRHVDNPC